MHETVDAATEAAAHAAEGAAAAGQHAPGHSDDVGATIMHHISDSSTWDFFGWEIHLPHFTIGGIDFSITKHVVMMWIAASLLILFFTVAFRKRSLVPRGFANLLEMLVVFVRDEIAIKYLGEKHGRRLAPYVLTLFFFILACNLIGLLPSFATATGNVNVTAGLALLSLLMIQGQGIREFGFFKHFKNLVPHGLPVFVMPIMIIVEAMGIFVKPFALCIRLCANMTAGHVAILAFLGMIFIFKTAAMGIVSVPLALAIMLLELFVAFLQAFVFTMLTSLFMGFSIHPSH
jgi:F-type H+-transporting ATPase subunit a